MHPDFLRALARDHQEELRRQQRFRHDAHAVGPPSRRRTVTKPIGRARVLVGRALVAAGTRLLAGRPVTLDLFEPRR
jgi:hypothetical protein